MAASNWFGDLQLAYKYIVVFCGLLVLVFLAGLVKVFFDRRKLKQHSQKEELEAGPKEDTVELNQREKDEGDLFGIRAIEAGFYAGVAQSRPTSRAGSVINHPAMSSSTLVGGVNSPLMKNHSNNNSVLSLNLGRTNSQGGNSPPSMKLRPSEAELTGKHGAVDMSLRVPPSPGHPRGQSQSFGGSDSGSDDDFTSPRSTSPRSADFNHQHYAPTPKVAMPDALQVTYHGQDNTAKSQAASFNSSPGQSPTPPSPGNPPAARLPTLPGTALRKESRSPSPEYYSPRVRVEHPNIMDIQPDLFQAITEPAPLSTAPTLQPKTYAPAPASASAPAPVHKRYESDASSTYSQNRMSTFDAYQAYQKQSARAMSATSSEPYDYNFSSSTDDSRGTSMVLSVDNNPPERRPSETGNHLALPTTQNGQESRLSEFYDAYYRDSQVGPVQVLDAKRIVGRHSTIVEVDTPLASPMFPKAMQHPQPGAAF